MAPSIKDFEGLLIMNLMRGSKRAVPPTDLKQVDGPIMEILDGVDKAKDYFTRYVFCRKQEFPVTSTNKEGVKTTEMKHGFLVGIAYKLHQTGRDFLLVVSEENILSETILAFDEDSAPFAEAYVNFLHSRYGGDLVTEWK
jgi:hypothetical protein